MEIKRISKAVARVLYNNGKDVIACPCNLDPLSMWRPYVTLNKRSGYNFDDMLARAHYYNCVDEETGMVLSLYIEGEVRQSTRRLVERLRQR